jgi:hypothetical protein
MKGATTPVPAFSVSFVLALVANKVPKKLPVGSLVYYFLK